MKTNKLLFAALFAATLCACNNNSNYVNPAVGDISVKVYVHNQSSYIASIYTESRNATSFYGEVSPDAEKTITFSNARIANDGTLFSSSFEIGAMLKDPVTKELVRTVNTSSKALSSDYDHYQMYIGETGVGFFGE